MYDAIIIGGGVVGLAIGRIFALSGCKVALLEAKDSIGAETSFRNSAVVHAGLYYPRNSLKALLCNKGKSLLKEYCLEKNVPFKAIGKLIVAVNDIQIKHLLELQDNSVQHGVKNLLYLRQEELHAMEPAVKAVGALFSPDTAIINGQMLLQALKEDFLQAGGELFTQTKVIQCDVIDYPFCVQTQNTCCLIIKSKIVINAAGLWAQEIAEKMEGLDKKTIPPRYLAKGNYFKYLRPSPFKHLIYPIPETAGLGIHATIDVRGDVRFGPDVEWIDHIDYTTSSDRKTQFIEQIKLYYPDLDEAALVPDPDHTGIRPKILPPHLQPQDFLIQTVEQHGIKGLTQLYGIESPGLTASLAIAEYVFQANSNNLP